MKSCFFIGHREFSHDLYPALKEQVDRHIREYDVSEFIVGSYGQFDRLAAKVLAEARQQHPHIALLQLTPYLPAERKLCLYNAFDCVFFASRH